MQYYSHSTRVLLLGLLFLCNPRPDLCAADLLHVRHEGGWNSGVLMEFRSDPSGSFEWRKRTNPDDQGKAVFETLTGKLKLPDLEALIDRVRKSPEGPKANDVGSAIFEWDDHGNKQSKLFLFPARPPCSELLAAVDRLAQSAGKRRP